MRSISRLAIYRRESSALMYAVCVAMICAAAVPGTLWGQALSGTSLTINGNSQLSGSTLLSGPTSVDTANWFPYSTYGDFVQLKLNTGFYVQTQVQQGPFPTIFAVNATTNAIGGTVSIGSASAQCPPGLNGTCALTVRGAIAAGEVLVTNTLGADYVFDPSYRLRPLPEVAAYIQEHHHLPEIPSAAEVKEKGVSLGDMQAKLLAKIEELTLHLILADEKNRELQERVAKLEAGGR